MKKILFVVFLIGISSAFAQLKKYNLVGPYELNGAGEKLSLGISEADSYCRQMGSRLPTYYEIAKFLTTLPKTGEMLDTKYPDISITDKRVNTEIEKNRVQNFAAHISEKNGVQVVNFYIKTLPIGYKGKYIPGYNDLNDYGVFYGTNEGSSSFPTVIYWARPYYLLGVAKEGDFKTANFRCVVMN
jgi:hypothetical protein